MAASSVTNVEIRLLPRVLIYYCYWGEGSFRIVWTAIHRFNILLLSFTKVIAVDQEDRVFMFPSHSRFAVFSRRIPLLLPLLLSPHSYPRRLLVADARLFSLYVYVSFGRKFSNCKRFLQYRPCACPTVRDWGAVFLAFLD